MKLLRGKPFAIKLVYYQNSQFVFKILVVKYWFNKVSRTCIKIWEYSIKDDKIRYSSTYSEQKLLCQDF